MMDTVVTERQHVVMSALADASRSLLIHVVGCAAPAEDGTVARGAVEYVNHKPGPPCTLAEFNDLVRKGILHRPPRARDSWSSGWYALSQRGRALLPQTFRLTPG